MSKEARRLDPLVSCMVPVCKNSVLKHPKKHFFYVPKSARVQWCAAVNKKIVPKSASIYICEDHLNIEEDLLNYKEWSENKVTRPRLNPIVPQYLRNIGNNLVTLPSVEKENISPFKMDKAVMCMPDYMNKSVQVTPKMKDCSVLANIRKIEFRPLNIDEESSEECYPSVVGSTTEFSGESSSEVPKITKAEKKMIGRNFILNLIINKPFAYIGIPKQYYWLIDHLSKGLKIPEIHIIITLYKIKNNDSFSRMKDIFQISISTLSRVFYKTLKMLSLFFKQLIYWPTPHDIKKNLPCSFSSNKDYASVQSIIDCFEIEIEKPKRAIDQALSWSQYKNCNTVKYLVGATPDGFINFISEGYGGRITDMYLVEQSGFMEVIPAHVTILSDRGFKNLESLLIHKSVKVLRPPSVSKDTKMTKSEVVESKILASLRIHIERVIRRVRLFKILKPHSVVNNKFVNVLDDIVTVACGLINLQSPILKQK